jgi:protein-tyrosine-phosphatase
MRIAVVCRHNKARSPFAEAVIKYHFPEFSVQSLGIEPTDGEPTSDFAQAIADRWGIGDLKKKATSIKNSSKLLKNADLIIFAENSMMENFKSQISNSNMASMDQIAIHEELRPTDPDGLGEAQFERELAKVANTTLRIVYEHLETKNRNEVVAFIPRGTTDIAQTLAHAHFEARNRNAVLIDADCRAPHGEELAEAGLTPVDSDFTIAAKFPLPTLDSDHILRHVRELDRPEKFFLGKDWKKIVDGYSQHSDVVLVTAPRRSRSRTLSDSFLSSYFADQINVISS